VPAELRPTAELAATPVIVTGGAGFIGSHTVRALAHGGRAVVATDVTPTLNAEALRGLDVGPVTYIAGDLRSDATVDRAMDAAGGPADVVHLAAMKIFSEPHPPRTEVLDGLAVNVMGSVGLCTRLAATGMLRRFVHISTRSVFAHRAPSREPIPADAAYCPSGIYGFSKAAAELGVLAAGDAFDIDVVIARITGIFGPWKQPATVVDRLFDAVVRRSAFRLPTGDADSYELTYVKDTVRGILAVLHARTLPHTVYHVASGTMTTLAEVADALRSADPGADIDLGAPGRSDMWPRTPLDGSRVADDVGFRARWGVADAAADFVRIARGGAYGLEVETAGAPRKQA
jgi:nucleoside-diphosphate-sugar epimerase